MGQENSVLNSRYIRKYITVHSSVITAISITEWQVIQISRFCECEIKQCSYCIGSNVCLSRSLKAQSVEGRKEMFYLMTHSAHFIYGFMMLDIWYRTTQIRREDTHCCLYMGYFVQLATRFFYMHHPRQNSTAFVTPVVEDWLERKTAIWVHHEGSITTLIAREDTRCCQYMGYSFWLVCAFL